MKRFKFLSWAGAIFNFLACAGMVQAFLMGLWFPQIITLLVAGAGLVLCIDLIKKKAVALPKARFQLLFSAAWSVLGSGIAYIMSPQSFTANPVLMVANVSISVVLYLIVWKVWSSENAASYVAS